MMQDWMNATESGRNIWKLFKGLLSELTDAVKCNYIIYWSGDHGMDLVDKWISEKFINDGNKNNLKTYWGKFDEYIHPKKLTS